MIISAAVFVIQTIRRSSQMFPCMQIFSPPSTCCCRCCFSFSFLSLSLTTYNFHRTCISSKMYANLTIGNQPNMLFSSSIQFSGSAIRSDTVGEKRERRSSLNVAGGNQGERYYYEWVHRRRSTFKQLQTTDCLQWSPKWISASLQRTSFPLRFVGSCKSTHRQTHAQWICKKPFSLPVRNERDGRRDRRRDCTL